jgi:transcriptional regulator with XRE-family HTH domain
MYQTVRERLLEEKKKLNISTRSMSERSKLQLPETTIKRVLSGETNKPGVDTVSDIAETLGVQPYEIFMDSITAAEFRAYQELRFKADETTAERLRLIAENEELIRINLGLSDKIGQLEMMIAHRDDIIRVYKDCIDIIKANIKE